MMNYFTIELNNNEKYVVVEMLNINNKMYFLLAKILLDDKNIDNLFEIFVFNKEKNSFEEICDIEEYNFVKNNFNYKMNEKRNILKNNELSKISRFKIVEINDFNVKLIDNNGRIINLEVELFDDLNFEIDDYIYLNDKLLDENNIIRLGFVYTDNTEIIKVVRRNKIFYLQRYYG